MPSPSKFGQRLKIAREKREWTQLQLGERADVAPMMISHFETGVRASPSLLTLQSLADALNVGVEWLLGRTDDPTPVAGPLAALFRAVAEEGSGDKLEIIKAMLQSATTDAIKSEKKD